MKRYLLIILLCFATGLYAADVKMTDLTEDASPSSDDIVWTTNSPASSPSDRKVTLGNISTLVKTDMLDDNNTFTGSNIFNGAATFSSTVTMGSSTGVQYATSGVVSTSTSLSSVSLSGFTASKQLCSDGSGVATTCSTQPVTGKVPIITKTDDYTLGTDDSQEAYGYMVFMSGDSKILTLPAVVAGMSVCVYSTDATAKVVDPNASDGIRNGTAARNADGHKITSDASAGAFVCLLADSADGWTVLGKSGVWSDE